MSEELPPLEQPLQAVITVPTKTISDPATIRRAQREALAYMRKAAKQRHSRLRVAANTVELIESGPHTIHGDAIWSLVFKGYPTIR